MRFLAVLLVTALAVAFGASATFSEAKKRKRPSVAAAESAVRHELNEEYNYPHDKDAYCHRLTDTRFKCHWYAEDAQSIELPGLGGLCDEISGKARARKYKYDWDVKLYAVSEILC